MPQTQRTVSVTGTDQAKNGSQKTAFHHDRPALFLGYVVRVLPGAESSRQVPVCLTGPRSSKESNR